MMNAERVLAAVKASGARKIALIDDAFDAPVFKEANAVALLEFLEDDGSSAALAEADVADALRAAAIAALTESRYGADEIAECFSLLYGKFRSCRHARFDPGDVFSRAKGDTLKTLDPLVSLLSRSADLQIVTIGRSEDYAEKAGVDTHVIFADFYLIGVDDLAEDLDSNAELRENSIRESIERVNALVSASTPGARPSVVVMSSHEVEARAEEYRSRIRGDVDKQDLVYKSQFFFLEKAQLKFGEGDAIAMEQPASDVLLDIFQSFEFGRALNGSLDTWLKASTNSVTKIRDEIVHLSLKDFAYLVKFRLGDEGQDLLDYLEWFFGQCLLDQIGKTVDGIPELAGWSKQLEAAAIQVEGAFDGATTKVAELYHRVRIEGLRRTGRPNYRMGDLYVVEAGGTRSVAAIITPDCDLIFRGTKRNVQRITTIAGKLTSYDGPTSAVSNFILVRENETDVHYNVNWNVKDLRTWDLMPPSGPVEGMAAEGEAEEELGETFWPQPNASDGSRTFIGTLRPLYAQQLQREVLHDFGRVGVPVAPAIAMAAKCRVSVRKADKSIAEIDIGNDATAAAWIVLGRGGSSDKGKVVFARGFVTRLLETLSNLDPATLIRPADMAAFKQPAKILKLYETMCRNGVPLGKAAGYGIEVTEAKPKGPPDGPLCWITLSKAEDPVDPETATAASLN